MSALVTTAPSTEKGDFCNMTQESVRNRLIRYIEEKGVKLIFISRKIDVPDYLMAKFKTAKRELWNESLERLDQFLTGENY